MRVTDRQQVESLLGVAQGIRGDLLRLREMVASGKKVNRPSDDASAFERITRTRTVLEKTDKRLSSIGEGLTRLNVSEDALGSANNIIQRAKEIALQQRNATSSGAERKIAAREVQQLLLGLLDSANTQVEQRFLFAGFETQTPPYALTSVTASAPSPAITAANTNQGTTTSAVSISTAASLTGNQYSITFTDPTTFDVTNTTTGASVLTGQTYASGTPFVFDGLSVTLTDNPAGPLGGDVFTIGPNNASDATVTATVTTPALVQPHLYEIRFTSATAFNLVDVTTDTVLSSGNAYVSGNPIVFAGITATVSDGTVSPQANDVFRVRPSYTYQGDTGKLAVEVEDGKTVETNVIGSQVFSGPTADSFSVIQDLEQALLTNTPDALDTVIGQLDTAQDQLVSGRTVIGAQVGRLDRVKDGLDLLTLSTQTLRSKLEDSDLAKVSAQLATLETNLTASLLTLNKQFEVSLLNFLR